MGGVQGFFSEYSLFLIVLFAAVVFVFLSIILALGVYICKVRFEKDIQRSPLFYAPGLVKFVPAVARLFCLALPGSFLNVLCAE